MASRAGTVALALAGVALTGCTGAVPVDAPELAAADARACADLLDALPDTVAGEARRPVSPEGAPGAAWGDPAIVLTCGVGEPEGFDEFASCIEVGRVGWFAPAEELAELRTDLVVTALTHRPRVALRVPPEHRGEDAVLADLSPALRRALERSSRCR